MDKYIGRMLDNRYEILEIIGRGGMAVVYKAKCHRLNRFVAVKILKDELAKDEDFRRRFRDESQSVAMLSHPNIVSVYDVSRSGDVEYIVMELIDGITLNDYLERKSPLKWDETTFFAMQIAKALEHAHSRGIIHRDIKPQNIMLLRDGTVKVADFGIARHAASNNTCNIGEAIGSVHYVSPEQAKGSHIDNRADIYSLGVVMYEMLSGRLPFEGDSPLAVALQHINSIPLAPSDYVAGIPQTLEAITMKAMSPALAGRYTSATEMLSDIEHFRNDPQFKVDIARNTTVPQSEPEDDDDMDGTRIIRHGSPVTTAVKAHRVREEVLEPVAKKKNNSSMAFTITAIAIFFIGAIFFILAVIDPFGSKPKNDSTLAPNIVGKTIAELEKDESFKEKGYEIVEKEKIFDDKTPEGEIISQDPKSGEKMGEDKIINVTVSRGTKAIILADYSNMEYREVQIELDKLNLEYTQETEYSAEFAKDYVIKTTPAEGSEMQEGDSVTLVVSKGAEIVQAKMPNLVGWGRDDAVAAITKAGLIKGEVIEVESTAVDGSVVFQSIPAGASIATGTKVDLHISKKETPVAPPVTEPTEPDTPTAPTTPTETTKFLDIDLVTTSANSNETISVIVQVNGKTQYEKTHKASEKTITVKLTAPAGNVKIKVIQNDQVSFNDTVTF